MRGSVEERIYLVDQWAEVLWGDSDAGDHGGHYAESLSCGWDAHGESYLLVAPDQVWRGQITGRTWSGDASVVTWDFVMATTPLTDDDRETFHMRLPDNLPVAEKG